MKLSSRPFALPLRRPLATAAGVLRERAGELWCAEAAGGCRGWGEATPVPGFGTPGAFRAAARECARRDLEARAAGERLCDALARELGTAPRARVGVNALLVCEAPDALAHEARRAVDGGHCTLKLKIDGRDPVRALERVRAVRRAVDATVRVRLDANRSLPSPQAALRLLDALAEIDVEHLEEPLARPDPPGWRRLRGAGVPLAADESAADPAAARRLLGAGVLDALVLKPSLLGLGGALALAGAARDAGVRVVVTSALDGAVARAAALHLAAALPEPRPDCGLATGALLADDLAPFPAVVDGALPVPPGPGLGLEPDPTALARLGTGRGSEPGR